MNQFLWAMWPSKINTIIIVIIIHSLDCRQAPGRIAMLNHCIYRALGAARIPVCKKPSGLVRTDGKRPDGCSRLMDRRQAPRLWCYRSLHGWKLLCTSVFHGSRSSYRAGNHEWRGQILSTSWYLHIPASDIRVTWSSEHFCNFIH